MKKWIYSICIVLFFVVVTYVVALWYLKANGIAFSSFKIQLPFSIKVKDLTINTPVFKMTLGEAEVDLSVHNLLKSRFSGHELSAQDIQITIHPSDSPFSYSVIPVLQFDKVSLKNVLIRVPNKMDTIDLSFPEFTLDQLNWNDSIQVNQLNYKNGKFSFRYHSNSEENKVNQGSPSIEIPDAVPKFKINQLKLHSLDLELLNQDALTEINNIHLELHGWNNTAGANLDLDSLSFLVQDSLNVAITSNSIKVQNKKGAGVKNLKIMLPGLNVQVNEFLAKQTNSGTSYSITLGRSSFSPTVLRWLNRDLLLLRPDAPEVFFEGNLNYTNDTLKMNEVLVSLLDHTKVNASGFVQDPTHLGSYFFKLSPLMVAGKELEKVFSITMLPELSSSKASSEIEIWGNANRFVVDANLAINAAKAQLQGKFYSTNNKHWVGDVSLNSNVLNVNDLLPGAKYDLTAFGLRLNTHLDMANTVGTSALNLALTIDTLVNGANRLVALDADVELINNRLRLYFGDAPGSWNADLEITDLSFDQQDLAYTGKVRIDDLSKISGKMKGGPCISEFQGKVNWSKDSVFANLHLNTCWLTHESGTRVYFDQSNLEMRLKNQHCSIQITQADSIVMVTQFDLELLNWLKRPNKPMDSIPEVYLYSKLSIDSNLTDMLAGYKIHAQIQPIEIRAHNNNIKADINIPLLVNNGVRLNNLQGDLVYNAKSGQAKLLFQKFTNPLVDIDSLLASITLNQAGNMHYALKGYIPSVRENLSIAGDLKVRSDTIELTFNNKEPLRMGGQTWFSESDQGLLINNKTFQIKGHQAFYNEQQRIELSGTGKRVDLKIDALRLGPLADLFITDLNAKANLSLKAAYVSDVQQWQANGSLDGIMIDTLDLGYIAFDLEKNMAETRVKANATSSAWKLNYSANSFKDGFMHSLILEQLNLGRVDSVLGFIPKQYAFSGELTGQLDMYSGTQRSLNGQLKFNHVAFRMDEYGTAAILDQQNLSINNNRLLFENFAIKDNDENKMVLNGSMKFDDKLEFDLGIKASQFELLNNQNPQSLTRGKLMMESDIQLVGKGDKFKVRGNLNIIKGGTVYHQYKGAVKLSESEEVIFTSFSESDKAHLVKRKPKKSWLVDWNVDLNLGSTDIYVLFSKSKHEYMRLSASGGLQLRTGEDILPEVFGTVLSKNGKVYYEVPMVSDIEMDVSLAKLNFRGDPRNPLISFKGVETFRVTPNEMSSSLNDKKNRVPVYVGALVDEKPLNAIQLNFEINSENAEVQNMLLALPKETRETYAINMLVFGRINKGTESGNATMMGVVKKMNEISRRNIKNADLSFHVENTGTDNTDGTQNGSKIGYSFSKGFNNERVKITVGGDFELGHHSAASHSTPLGSIQLEYNLRDDPDVSLVLQRENSYKGPIEGQVDESGVIFKYRKHYKNLFKKAGNDSLRIR